MQIRKYSILMGALLLGSLSANAQTPSRSYTSVDAYGNVTRTTVQTPLAGATSVPGLIANQGVLGPNTTTSSSYTYRADRDNHWDKRDRPSARHHHSHYPPAYYPPAYPYPYPYPPVGYHYYPAPAYTIPLGEKQFNGHQVPTITIGPTIGYNGYPAPPAYPYYPPTYPVPYPYAGYPYPGTTTIITGSDRGGIYTHSQSSGYGLSVGRGGISGHVNNNRSSSSTVITTR